MPNDPDSALEGLRLPDDAARRLLVRAGQLDSQASGIPVAQLRQAAAEAGISAHAFEAALGELWRDIAGAAGSATARPGAARRSLWWPEAGRAPRRLARGALLLVGGLALFVAGAVLGSRATQPRTAPPWEVVVREPVPKRELPPAAPGGERPYFEFQVDRPVVPLTAATPIYPAALQSRGVSGLVIAQFVVDERGRVDVGTFKAIESTNQLFTSAVGEALPRLRFRPAELGGRPVSQLVQQPFVFNLGR